MLSFSPLSLKQKIKALGLATLVLSTMAMVYNADKMGHLLQGNLIGSISHAPVDGFEYPLPQIPDWAQVGYQKNSRHWDEFTQGQLIPIPQYDPSKRAEVNQFTTFTTLYLGKYDLGEKACEECASHYGVDIVAPEGTPVVSIANGVVEFAGVKNGYGNVVVVRHDQVPVYEDSTQKTTYRSGYSHLSAIEPGLQAGTVVTRGQKIAEVGDQGFATTYHLHFTLDRANAPFFPYWSFTSAEATAAGYNLFSAVDSTIGLANGLKYGVNPLRYIDKYKSVTGGSSIPNEPPPSPAIEPPPIPSPEPPPLTSPVLETPEQTPPSSPPGIDPRLFRFELQGEVAKIANGNGSPLTLLDSLNSMAGLEETVELPIEISGVGQVNPKVLHSKDFKDGKAVVYFSSNERGLSHITVGKSTHSVTYFNRDEIGATDKLDLEFEGEDLYQNTIHTLYVKALDLEGRPTPLTSFTGEIAFEVSEGSATFNPSTLRSSDFEGGIAKVQVTPGGESALELRARNGAIVSEKERFSLRVLKTFKDVPLTHTHAKAIYTLRDAGVISGHPDGSFKPEEPINRVATLKILMLAAGVPIQGETELNFKDLEKEAWYLPTLMAAVKLGIVDGYPDGTFKPDNDIINAELAKVLLEAFKVEVSEDLKAPPYEDVSVKDWFAKYAYIINKRNLKDTPDNRYEPAQPATRADVAEMAYRLKVLLEQNRVSYVETGA